MNHPDALTGLRRHADLGHDRVPPNGSKALTTEANLGIPFSRSEIVELIGDLFDTGPPFLGSRSSP